MIIRTGRIKTRREEIRKVAKKERKLKMTSEMNIYLLNMIIGYFV